MDSLLPGLIGMTIFGMMTAYFARDVWRAWSSHSWPVVEGQITLSQIRRWRRVRGGQEVSTWNHAPEIRYQYLVAGHQYHAHTICFGREWNTNEFDAHDTLKRYPSGARVRVWYDPQRPNHATLEPRASSRVYLMLCLSSFMMTSIAIGIIYGV